MLEPVTLLKKNKLCCVKVSNIKYYFMYFSEYYLIFNLNALINKYML